MIFPVVTLLTALIRHAKSAPLCVNKRLPYLGLLFLRSSRFPYTTRPISKEIQNKCSDLRRTWAHLFRGTHPSKQLTDIKDVKKYLQTVILAQDGLVVVRRNDPLFPQRDAIVAPRHAIHALLTALHIKLGHPTKHQMHQVVT